MQNDTHSLPLTTTTMGLDIGDRTTFFYVVSASGEQIGEGTVATKRGALEDLFARESCRVVLEASCHVHWIAELASGAGHEVVVANPREVRLISHSHRKNDRNDARTLAQLGRADPSLLRPVRLRNKQSRATRSLLHARDKLVGMRTRLVNEIRGFVKTAGGRVPSGAAASFHRRAGEHIPEELREACDPLLAVLESLATQIKEMDATVERACQERHPETAVLRQIQGVGPLLALAYVATIETPDRFASSRTVGSYLGLTPRQSSSGSRTPQLRISKCGDRLVRKLLVNAATYILGHFGPDCELRRFGMRIARGGAQRDKARARIAVARKLACILHQLWRTGSVYQPLAAS